MLCGARCERVSRSVARLTQVARPQPRTSRRSSDAALRLWSRWASTIHSSENQPKRPVAKLGSKSSESRTSRESGFHRMATIIDAEPEAIGVNPERTAVIVIDMQRDFLEPGGFGESLGNDVSLLTKAIEPIRALLVGARKKKMLVIHTRDGHRPDLSDAPKAKVERGAPSMRIGAPGPMGRILIRGEPGQDIIP